MAQRTQLELYGLFQTGLAPSQQDFHDFIDTVFAGDTATMQVAQAAQTAAAAAQTTVANLSGLVARAFGAASYSTRDGLAPGFTVLQHVGCTVSVSGITCTVTFNTPATTTNYIVIFSSTLAGSLNTNTPIITRTTTHFSFALPATSLTQGAATVSLDFVVFGT